MPTPPTTPSDGRRPSARALAALGAATRPDDGDRVDPPEWIRQAQDPAGRHRAERHRPSVATVPLRLRGARLGVSRSAVLGVAVVALVIVLVGGVRVAWALQDAHPETVAAEARETRESALESAPTADGGLARDDGASEPPPIVVHVAGQVERPGIVRLPSGARVVDALDAAGGPTAEADLAAVNLARQVIDGEQVYVPLPDEAPPAAVSGPVSGVIDLNTADATALVDLPGVGPVLAERIVDWRTEHGRFTSVDELGEVSGIGEKLLAVLRDKVRVGS